VKIRLLTLTGHELYSCNSQVCDPAGQDFVLSALTLILLTWKIK